MYGQLAAIAREFNLPSTTGLFLYLQVSEGGVHITPRVTDETWQLLWGHFFVPDQHAPSYPAHQLPIGGRVEFDIDVRKAKWFGAWVRSRGRIPQFDDVQSIAHLRQDSRNTTLEDDLDPESEMNLSPPAQSLLSIPSARPAHIKQLSLLDRRHTELPSIRTSLRRGPQRPPVNSAIAEFESPAPAPRPTLSLNPNTKQASLTKEIDIDSKVRSWRQSTPTVPPVNLDAGADPALPPTLPNTASDFGELNMEDFVWAPSSTGPKSWAAGSVDLSEAIRSVHLAERLEGSVAMTPTTATSFGPPRSGPLSSAYSFASRYPSPDIAARMLEDAPCTPSTATSWGAPESYPPTPESQYRYPTPDMAHRMYEDAPCTPTTATSWGAPESYPPTPTSQYRYPSPDIAYRMLEDVPVTPSTATSWGPPEFYPESPILSEGIRTPDIGERLVSPSADAFESHMEMGWPYYSAWEAQPYGHVWPYQYVLQPDDCPNHRLINFYKAKCSPGRTR